jgi:hypothetical protein
LSTRHLFSRCRSGPELKRKSLTKKKFIKLFPDKAFVGGG